MTEADKVTEDFPLEWQLTKPRRFLARDLDGYRLQVWLDAADRWRWSVRAPGGGYNVASGADESADAAKQSAEKAYRELMCEILRCHEERLMSLRNKKARRNTD